MEQVLGDLIYEHVMVYIDDYIILGKDLESHYKSLDLVLDRLREAGLKLKASKCSLFRDKLLFLGYEVSTEGMSSDPSKLEVIQDWPVPKKTKDIKKFLDVLG